ncbi:MAG TPA: DUF2924 domain-containing protein, partial [Stellaceae bacterium]|nr:DUF2924 domain-containing protein [Stellaceae bacterium]
PHRRRQSFDERQGQSRSQGRLTNMVRRSPDPEGLEAEIDRVRLLDLDRLRARWRTTFRSSPPPALTTDLMARMVAWSIQEQALGGPDAATLKLLDSLARGEKPEDKRRLKPGTVLVREYQGGRHTVTVVPGGFLWRDSVNALPETGPTRPKPRECRRVSQAEQVSNRDWNGWLGRQDSNSRVQRRGPDHKGGRPCGTFFCKKDWTSAAHRASVSSSMPADWPHRDQPPLATPPQRGFGGDGT